MFYKLYYTYILASDSGNRILSTDVIAFDAVRAPYVSCKHIPPKHANPPARGAQGVFKLLPSIINTFQGFLLPSVEARCFEKHLITTFIYDNICFVDSYQVPFSSVRSS